MQYPDFRERLVDGKPMVTVRGAFINGFDGNSYEEAFVVVNTVLDCDRTLDYIIFVIYDRCDFLHRLSRRKQLLLCRMHNN